jgi:apoptosis-inducing factor 2
VQVERLDGTRTAEGYDVLVIATGVSNGFWRQPRVETLDEIEDGLASTRAQLAGAGTIAVVGGGATGVSAAGNLARRHPGTQVHLFFSGEEPLPEYHARTRRQIVRALGGAGVHLHAGHRARIPDGFDTDRLTTGPVEWTTGQEPFEADVTLWAVGRIRPNSEWLPADMLDEAGFVRVDEHLRVPGHPNVFAVGDLAASDPHRSSARNWGYRVVAGNIRALERGREDRLRRFKAPETRWGSILGVQDDGMVVHQPNGAAFRVPRWAVQPLLFDLYLNTLMYRGVRRSRATGRR